MRVIITGGTGLLGRFLVQVCKEQGYEIRVLANKKTIEQNGVEYIYGNITKYSVDDFADLFKGYDSVCNLAAEISIPYSYEKPELFFETNTMSVIRMSHACMKTNVGRFIQTSTSETLGTAINVPMDEQHRLQAQSPYAASKAATDLMIQSFVKSYNFNAVILKCFNMYGEWQSPRALIPALAIQVITKDEIMVGSLDTRRDFTHASDSAKAFVLAMEKPNFVDIKGQIFHICSGNCVLGKDILLSIQQILDKQVKVVQDPKRVRPKDSEVQLLKGDYRKVNKVLGWQPSISFYHGLVKTVEYIKEHIDEYAPDRYAI